MFAEGTLRLLQAPPPLRVPGSEGGLDAPFSGVERGGGAGRVHCAWQLESQSRRLSAASRYILIGYARAHE